MKMSKNFCARCRLLVERTLVISGNTGNGVLDWAEPGGWAKLFLRLSLLSHCDKYKCSIYCTQSFSGVGLYLNANGLLLIVYDWFILWGYVELLLVMVPEVLYSIFLISSICLSVCYDSSSFFLISSEGSSIMFSLGPSYWMGRVYKWKWCMYVCLSVIGHHFK